MEKLKYLSVVYSDRNESKDVEELIAAKENYWKGWACSAGMKNLYIDYDGNVFVCNNSSSKVDRFNYEGWEARIKELKEKGVDLLTTESHESGLYRKHQRAFERSGNGFSNEIDFYNQESFKKNWGYLGSIYQDFQINKNILECPYDQCGCGADIPIAKAKNKKDLLTYLHFGGTGLESSIKQNPSKEPELRFVSKRVSTQGTVLWDLGRRCNYDCSYCWPAVHNAKEEHKDIELLIKTCKKIIEDLAPGEAKLFCFSGGEPTLHPYLKELLEYIHSQGSRTLITTNGSAKPDKWQELVPLIVDIQMSAHFEFLNEKRFLENVDITIRNMIETNTYRSLDIKLMTPPNQIPRSLKLKEQIKELSSYQEFFAKDRSSYLGLSLVPLRGIENSESLLDYTEEELKHF